MEEQKIGKYLTRYNQEEDVGKIDPYELITVIEANSKNAFFWFNLGLELCFLDCIPFHGEKITRQHCFFQAVKINVNHSDSWMRLGETFEHGKRPNFEPFHGLTKQECFVKAVLKDPKSKRAWFLLGTTVADYVRFDSERLEKKDCFKKAIEIDPSFAQAWLLLGTSMISSEAVVINDKPFMAQECLIKAVEHEEGCSEAWHSLGLSARRGYSTITLSDGRVLSYQECFAKAKALAIDQGKEYEYPSTLFECTLL